MKENEGLRVLIINGSPHEHGSCRRAIDEAASILENEGIACDIVQVGEKSIRGCTACKGCKKLGKCVFDDEVNSTAEAFYSADGVIVVSPVYYSSPNGTLISFLDRLFFSTSFDKRMKVGAAIVSARRGGCTATFDTLNKYFAFSGMPIASSNYWNQIHGSSYDEASLDLEGLQTVRALAKNMAFLIKAIRLARNTLRLPNKEDKIYTSFIR